MRALRALLGLIALAAAVWALMAVFGSPPAEAEIRPFTSSAQCRECHAEVYAEWEASWHSQSYVDPLVRAPDQSNDYANTDCLDCHAPREIFTTGIGERVLPRATRRVEGVDCIACHMLPDGQVAGTIENRAAPCRPVVRVELRRPEYCSGCHNQHGTVNQWTASRFSTGEERTICLDCHMPELQRANGSTGRNHLFLGGHDPGMLRRAVTLAASVQDGVWIAEVENVGAGHNYPTDERSRASDLFWRPVGEESWRWLYRFRNPYRFEVGLPNTELPAGEKVRVESPDAPAGEPVEVGLFYKLTPVWKDHERPDPEREARLVHGGVFQP